MNSFIIGLEVDDARCVRAKKLNFLHANGIWARVG